ncbi:MAG: hypothetical protein R2940_11985 [Syntrophotaleaceae bacterium]
MAFVNKTFTEAEQEEAQEIRVIVNRPCAVDRERKVALQFQGGGVCHGDVCRPHSLCLSYPGIYIAVDALRHVMVSEVSGRESIHWEVLQVHWPQKLSITPDELAQLLTEALQCYGKDGTQEARQALDQVSVDLSALQSIGGQLRCPGAFYNTELTDADKQRIGYDALRNPQVNQPIWTRTWTVNPEGDAFLMHIGGGGCREDYCVPDYFLLSHQGVRVRVDAWEREAATDKPRLRNIRWEIIRIHWPKDCPVAKDDLKQVLTEALACFGRTGLSGAYLNIDCVEVDFSKAQEV